MYCGNDGNKNNNHVSCVRLSVKCFILMIHFVDFLSSVFVGGGVFSYIKGFVWEQVRGQLMHRIPEKNFTFILK